MEKWILEAIGEILVATESENQKGEDERKGLSTDEPAPPIQLRTARIFVDSSRFGIVFLFIDAADSKGVIGARPYQRPGFLHFFEHFFYRQGVSALVILWFGAPRLSASNAQ